MRASLSVHLLLRWGDVVLQAVRVSPPRRFVLGESGDWELPADALGGPRLELLTVEDGHTVLSLATRGACVLREGARRRVELGPFSIDVEATCAESSPWVRSPLGLGPPAHHLLSAGVHLGLLAAFGSYPSPSAEDLDATGARDRAALLTGLLGRSDVDAVESPGPHDDGESVATGSRDERKTAGGTGEPAQTEEGALGNPVTRATRGHVGVQGPHDALDPRLARAAEEPLPETWPELVWLRVPAPDPDAPVAVWGRTLSEGTDAASARAPMWGGTIEAAMGPGGLGLSGTGEGGGFHAVAIGLGTFGLGEGRVDCTVQFKPDAIISRCDRIHLGDQVACEQEARNLAKIDAQVADPGAVRNRKVGGDPDKEFVQGQSLRSKRNQLARREPGETLNLGGLCHAGEYILTSEDRR